MIATFGRKQDNPAIVLSYAALEGLFLGAVSFVFANLWSPASAPGMIGQAIFGTVGVFFGMLVVYKTGAIRVTPKFTRMLVAAMFGVLALMLVNFVLAMFGVGGGEGFGLRSGGPLAIIFSLVCIGLAAFMLPDRLRPGRPDDPRRCAGEGRLGHRPRPDRHAGLAVPRDPAAAQSTSTATSSLARKPGTKRAGLFSCVDSAHRAWVIHSFAP